MFSQGTEEDKAKVAELENLLGVQPPPESAPPAAVNPGVVESGKAEQTSDQGKSGGALTESSLTSTKENATDESSSGAQASANFVGRSSVWGRNSCHRPLQKCELFS